MPEDPPIGEDAIGLLPGGVLFQLKDTESGTPMTKGQLHSMSIIMFLSYQFTPAQSRYHITERECLAVVKSLTEVR